MNEPCYVFDSYALLCFFYEEAGMEKVEQLLVQAEQQKITIFLSTVNLAEIYYSIYREHNESKAHEAMAIVFNLPIELVDVDVHLAIEAAQIKAVHSIALGDCFAIGLAQLKEATAVTGDPEFKTVEQQLPIIWLP